MTLSQQVTLCIQIVIVVDVSMAYCSLEVSITSQAIYHPSLSDVTFRGRRLSPLNVTDLRVGILQSSSWREVGGCVWVPFSIGRV
ncbi:hypothetical protein GGR50DRAFT_659626 [Xylaria sp. CBS 124048]|nr:hypothetical protein GGR50DRAFT_659626 [Xylaria sp. CBS 124048]